MGDLVQVDFNSINQNNDDHDDPSFVFDEEQTDPSNTDVLTNRVDQKQLEENVYKKTIRRIRHEYLRSKNYKKEKLYNIVKRLFDVSVAGSGITLFLPVFAGLSLLITLSDGGQPIFSQVRLGKNKKKLRIYKFRSMRMDSEDITKLLNPAQLKQFYTEYKVDNDPRITKIGKIIRKTSIDELPQLFNILEGDMSLIGPRPIVCGEMSHYSKKNLEKLLSVKPGLTGYWQAYARNKATYSDGLRQNMELYYVDNRSIGLDLKILVKTVISVVKQEGAQ